MTSAVLSRDRFFDPDPIIRSLAGELYQAITHLPIISPHGHVDPHLFADPDATLGSPADLFIIPDHYIFRMFYSQGISMESLGVPRQDGAPVEQDHRKIWQTFADHFYLFSGTPSGIWLAHELSEVFGCQQSLNSATAQEIYDQVETCLSSPEFQPRRLFERFNIETLCTSDPAWDRLESHQAIRASGWGGDIRPTFRPDGVINLDTSGWRTNMDRLSQASGIEINSVKRLIQALELQRAHFKSLGATATDHAALTPATAELSPAEAEAIFQRALKGQSDPEDATRFTAHMLMEMARMSLEDGLVMQLHPGSYRNHNEIVFHRFGLDMGADIPVQTEFTRNLLPLLNKYGHDNRLTLILFTLDETTYSRELAPLAGHYPALKLGPPWWFYDSLNGMARYFDLVLETAGIYNTAGFNDDTRAFCSIPARHDVWRRACANWLAGLAARQIVTMDDAQTMMVELTVGLAQRAYKL
jgi:glucuronate isomerase